MLKFLLDSPLAKLRVPFCATKSVPAVAVPSTVVKSTLVDPERSPVLVIVTVRDELPSEAEYVEAANCSPVGTGTDGSTKAD